MPHTATFTRTAGQIALVAASALLSSPAMAVQIYNTGVNATGTPLPVGSTDTHWTIVSGPGVTSPFSAMTSAVNALYVVSPLSTWIWASASAVAGTNSPYTFRLEFELTSTEASTVQLSGAWAVDNFGTIMLNGTAPTGSGVLTLAGVTVQNFNQFHEFNIVGGFLPGLNTLDFVVTDTATVGGLNVTNLAVSVVPELSTYSFMLLGGCMMGAYWRRRLQHGVA